jgi:DNA polymerase III delta prime subunit
MRLGDLLIRAKLVTVEQVSRALELQALEGGRLGDHLVGTGAITRERLNAFIHRTPAEPGSVKATGIEENELLALMIKVMYTARIESGRQVAEALKLPFHIVLELLRSATEQKLVYSRGARADSRTDTNYGFTDEGTRWANDAMQRSRYTGPAPVRLEEYTDQVNLQKITNEVVSFERVKENLKDLDLEDSLIEQCGPALNSGRAMLLYGPPGNGKTTFALRLATVFKDLIYVPYAVLVEGQIIRVFDPNIHIPVDGEEMSDDDAALFVLREEFDARWVPCKRPFVVAGGELTLEMLDLRYEPTSNFYEAPLHMKALGGCFVIDDFGRQLVSPTMLLNRWIVPLESRIDFLKLHTGKSFSIPFEELVMFSTNLEPEQLMDPAFLRRLPYKVEIGGPSVERFRRIFTKECAVHGLTLPEDVFAWVVEKIRDEKGLELAAFQARFILDQVVASCRFMGQPPSLVTRFLNYAIDNLRPRRREDAVHSGQ